MTGTIRFDTIPEKANIFIDGNFVAQSPVDISDAEPGKYSYKLSFGGYEDFVSSLTVYDNKITHITVNMQNGTETENFLDYPVGIEIDTEADTEVGVGMEQGIQYEKDKWGHIVPIQIPSSDIPGGVPEKQTVENTLGEIKSLLQQLVQQNAVLLENSNRQTERNLSSKFDTGIQTLAVAVITVPAEDDVSVTGYTRVAIKDVLNRLSQEIYLINQGPGTIYARKSNDGKNFSTTEIPIFAGEKATFNDLYELRIRSDISGTQYRVTEYETVLVINNFDDRAATPAHIRFGISTYGFHGLTTRASYTVPTGYKAKINGCYVFLQIVTPATDPNLRNVTVAISSPTIVGNISVMSRSFGNNENVDGMLKEGELGFSYTLLTGEGILLQTQNTATTGSVRYFGAVEITQYFSYPT